MLFYSHRLCGLDLVPQDVQDVFQWLQKDLIVHLIMYAAPRPLHIVC